MYCTCLSKNSGIIKLDFGKFYGFFPFTKNRLQNTDIKKQESKELVKFQMKLGLGPICDNS